MSIQKNTITTAQITVYADGFVSVQQGISRQVIAYISLNKVTGRRAISLLGERAGQNPQQLGPRVWTNTEALKQFCADYINEQP